jgi:hypothetical protein
MANRTIRTAPTRARFLETLGTSGNVSDTCRTLDLHRASIYDWRRDDAEFAAAWDEAVALGAEGLEDEARNRAINGSDILLIFMLKALKPEKYRERSTVDINQTIRQDYRNLPIEELRRRLDELRAEQDKTPLIEGNVIEFPTPE